MAFLEYNPIYTLLCGPLSSPLHCHVLGTQAPFHGLQDPLGLSLFKRSVLWAHVPWALNFLLALLSLTLSPWLSVPVLRLTPLGMYLSISLRSHS